jgi:hypothetical protein
MLMWNFSFDLCLGLIGLANVWACTKDKKGLKKDLFQEGINRESTADNEQLLRYFFAAYFSTWNKGKARRKVSIVGKIRIR